MRTVLIDIMVLGDNNLHNKVNVCNKYGNSTLPALILPVLSISND